MAAAVNPIVSAGIFFGDALAHVAESLRRATVRIKAADGQASGVVWSPNGLIMTNAHVVRSQRSHVELQDGTTLQGVVIGRDDNRDLAVLRVASRSLPVLSIRDARTLRVGEVVVTVGNPMGEERAASIGVVHQAPSERSLLITDLKLAPGNSGGPVADSEGRLVGIAAMVAFGLGCAIPSHAMSSFLRSHLVTL